MPRVKGEPGYLTDYVIQFTVKDILEPRNKDRNCNSDKEYKYSDCIDQQLQNLILPVYGCNPPWVSSSNQCQGESTALQNNSLVTNFILKNFKPIWFMEPFPAQDKCLLPCNQTDTKAVLRTRSIIGKDSKYKIGNR